MLNVNLISKTIFVVVIAIFATSLVCALGISPADKTLQFFSDESVDLSFNVVNSEGADLEVVLSSFGELKDAVFFENDTVRLLPSAYMNPFKLVLKMPSELSPGTHTVYVRITPKFGESQDMFRAFVSPIIPINVRVPYPSKYADVSLATIPVEEGTPVLINLVFDNFGSEDILSAGGYIAVFNSKGDIVKQLIAPEINIPKNTYAKSEAAPAGVLRKGSYLAVADAHYDSFNVSVSKNFTIGEPTISVSLLTKTISEGEINQVKFKARLDWDSAVQVKAFVKVADVERELPLLTLLPDLDSEIIGFADATGLSPGESDLELKLVFGSSVKTETFKINVVPKGLLPVSEPGKIKLFLIILVIVLIVIALAAVILFIKRKKKRRLGGGETFK